MVGDYPANPDPQAAGVDPMAPPPVAAPPPMKPADKLVTLPFTEKDHARWKGEIEGSIKRRKDQEPWWKAALENYTVNAKEKPDAYALRTRTNRAFATVERKIGDLFFQRPDLIPTPSPLLDNLPQGPHLCFVHSAILNEKLGIDGVDGEDLMQQAIFDYELFGIGCTKMGYRQAAEIIKDELTGQEIPLPIEGECFWENFSPKQSLLPAKFKSTKYDKAPWQGWAWAMSLVEARRLYGDKIPEDFQPNKKTDEQQAFDHGLGEVEGPESDMVFGVELYYRSSVFRADVANPKRLTQLVMIHGIKDPVVHRDSPDQTVVTPEWNAKEKAEGRKELPIGALSPDSLIGYPFHHLTVRVLTDSQYVMSDVAVGLPQTQELDKYREQGVRQRDINLIKWIANAGLVPDSVLNEIAWSPMGGIIRVPDEMIRQFREAIIQFPHAVPPPDNFDYAEIISRDYDRTLGVDAIASGVGGGGSTTATEANYRNANYGARMGREQNKCAKYYIKGATKYSTLVQRYLSKEHAAAIVGDADAQLWDAWRKVIPTPLAFTMLPDASLQNNAPLDRKQFMDAYSFLANDPTINRRYMNERVGLRFGLDPAKMLLPENQVPKPKEEPPYKLSINGDDLSPLNPQMPLIVHLLKLQGIDIPIDVQIQAVDLARMRAALEQQKIQEEAAAKAAPQGAAGAQPPHPGKVTPARSLDMHANAETGGMENTGQPMPGMGGGATM